MKEVKVVSWKEVGLNYKICEEIYEDVSCKWIRDRFVDVGFLRIMLEKTLEWVVDSSEFSWWEDWIVNMLDRLKEYSGDVMIEF